MNTFTCIADPQGNDSKGKQKVHPVVDAQGTTTIKSMHGISLFVFIINLFNADMFVVTYHLIVIRTLPCDIVASPITQQCNPSKILVGT